MGATQSALFKHGFHSKSKNVESWALVWLDESNPVSTDAAQTLRGVINRLEIFQDTRTCKKYIKSLSKDDRLIVLVSQRCGPEIVPQIQSYRQVASIFVYIPTGRTENEEWIRKFSKVKGVFTNLDVLISQIHRRTRCKAEEPLSISIFTPNSQHGKSTSELDGTFLHSEVSIDVLRRMKSSPTDKQELIERCRLEYEGNKNELAIIDEFERDYSPERALWWYTRESFVYRLLNKALRTANTDMLFLFRFFIRDIERQLEEHRCPQTVHVYRGQVISKAELQILKQSKGQFISMNSFLSTSLAREAALDFLRDLEISDDWRAVLFTIDADPRVKGSKPFANITAHSYFPDEDEVLIMLGSIFQLVDIVDDRKICSIRMRLCGDADHQLKSICEHMKNGYGGADEETDLLSFGTALFQMGKFDDAEKYFHRLLDQLPKDHPGIRDCYHNLGEIEAEKGDYDASLQWYYKSLDLKEKHLEGDHPDLAESHNSIGIVHRKKENYQLALASYEKAVSIFRRAFGDFYPSLAKCYNNIGNVYQIQKRYPDALQSYQRALDIQKKNLPAGHPDLGASYGNIAGVYQCLRQLDRALEHYKLSLDILEKTLPPEHPSIAMVLKNIGVVHEDKNELRPALMYFEKAANIRERILPPNHPHVRMIKDDIARVTNELRRSAQ